MSIRITIISHGEKTKYEAHETSEEILYIISGRGKIVIDDLENNIHPDILIGLPEGVMHQLINTGDESLKLLWVFSPPGPEEHRLDILNKEIIIKKFLTTKGGVSCVML